MYTLTARHIRGVESVVVDEPLDDCLVGLVITAKGFLILAPAENLQLPLLKSLF